MAADRPSQTASRAALQQAEQASADAGHENAGFLSLAHGFMPRERPRISLPPSHRAWDELAARLPELWLSVSVRDAIDELPTLSATDLPAADIWRASCLLSIFAHSYARVEIGELPQLPAAIVQPWEQITQHLQRPRPFLSYNDLIVYNWRLRDPDGPDPMRVENLDLLVPTVGNPEERIFYMTQVEILAQLAPLVGAVVRAQEAIVRDDPDALEHELLAMLERLRHVTEVSFHKIDPNPLSPTYVDPVVWATTVAPFAVALDPEAAGPSGTASPVFHMLDAFFGRRRADSFLGREMKHLGEWLPAHQRAFVGAVGQVAADEYIATSRPTLRGLFATVIEAYAGRKGYFGTHRTKVYGYLELAFKVGRSVTIGGFSGAFADRAWKQVDEALEASRRERYAELPVHARTATLERREQIGGTVARVVLDVSQAGVPFRPGDHCRVLAENTPQLCERTLAALRARGDEQVPLTLAWRELLCLRPGYEGAAGSDHVALADFVRFAKLRPLLRPVGTALLALTASERLDAILEAREEDQWELADALELIAAGGYDVRRLWRSELWQDEAIARIVPPDPFRTYSASCAPDGALPSTLELSVGRLQYAAADGASRHGSASTYLTSADPGTRLGIDVARAARFAPPDDPAVAIVMFAGGTGMAPFRSFLQQRAQLSDAGETWLFVAARTAEELLYRDELEALVAAGRLQLRAAFSRDPERPLRIGEVMLSDENAAALWHLLAPAGAGARAYVCGRAAFARSVTDALDRIGARFAAAAPLVRTLVAQRRLMQDVFTTAAAHTAPGVAGAGRYDASQLALHNDDEHGRWLAIDGNVYDVTEFQHLHPGGPAILRESVGLDASSEYRAVLHHESAEVDAQLAMYKIGAIRRLDFGTAWGIALVPGEGLLYVPLRELFAMWVRYLYLVVEMQNALRNDYGYLRRSLTACDAPHELSALKVQYAANTHARFLGAYFDGALGADLRTLFASTIGLCAPGEAGDRLDRELRAALGSPAGTAMREFSERSRTLYRELARDGAADADAPAWERARSFCALVEQHDGRFLAELKPAVAAGVAVFERHERHTLDHEDGELAASLLAIAGVARRYCERFAQAAGAVDGDAR